MTRKIRQTILLFLLMSVTAISQNVTYGVDVLMNTFFAPSVGQHENFKSKNGYGISNVPLVDGFKGDKNNFALSVQLNNYSGEFHAYTEWLGSGTSVFGKIKKNTLSIGLYPFALQKPTYNFCAGIGLVGPFLLNDRIEGTY